MKNTSIIRSTNISLLIWCILLGCINLCSCSREILVERQYMASVDENNKAEEFELPDEKVDELENFFNLI